MKKEHYQKDLEEWQQNQYLPGYYTGGKIRPQIKYGSKKQSLLIGLIGLVLIGMSILSILPYSRSLFTLIYEWDFLIYFFIFFSLGLICLLYSGKFLFKK